MASGVGLVGLEHGRQRICVELPDMSYDIGWITGIIRVGIGAGKEPKAVFRRVVAGAIICGIDHSTCRCDHAIVVHIDRNPESSID